MPESHAVPNSVGSGLFDSSRQRVIESHVQPNSGTTLVSKQIYANNQLFATEDHYGRRTYNAYDLSDGRLIRSI